MRSLLVLGLASLTAALATWLFWPVKADPLEFIPAEVAGLLLVNEIPADFDFLSRSRISDWISTDSPELQSALNEHLGSSRLEIAADSVEKAAFAITGLEQREAARFRIDFIGALLPRLGKSDSLRDWILETVVVRFEESGTVTRAEGPVTILTGSTPGLVFYLGEIQGCLLMANTEAGWRAIERLREEPQLQLRRQTRFQLAARRVPLGSDLFLYLRGGDAYGLVPEFAYGITLVNDRVEESYFELP